MTFAEPERFELCNVCAFPHLWPIEDYAICPCCGFQKMVDDEYEPIYKISQRWILGGMRWWSESPKAPNGWDPEKYQLPWLIEAYGKDWQE